jgi:hypothetical protein
MYLIEVIRLGEVGLPHLWKQRLAKVKEFILLKIFREISVLGMEVLRRNPI